MQGGMRITDGQQGPLFHGQLFDQATDTAGFCGEPGDCPAAPSHAVVSSCYKSLFDSNTEAIFLVNDQGRFTQANSAGERLSGYSQTQLCRMNFTDFCAEEFRQKALFFFARAMAGSPRTVELGAVCRDGTRIDVQISGTPIMEDGNVVGVFCTARDTTRQHRLEQQLRQACQDAEKAKDRFLAVISHELRTPLMPVLTTVQMLESRSEGSIEQREMLAMMRRNLELEARLIDDLLDLNRIRHGKLTLYMQHTDIHEKIRHVVDLCQSEIHEKKLRIRMDFQASHQNFYVDPARVQQVLWNVIGNAVKFTPSGGSITIQTCNGCPEKIDGKPECALKLCKARQWRREGLQQMLVIHVVDTGVGIDPREMHRLFNAFERPASGQDFGGAGIGLAISRALSELHGGELSAHSDGHGKGSVFTIMLPYRRSSVPDTARARPATGRRDIGRQYKLLLVEDHPDTAKVLTHLLKGFGFEVVVAATVASAVKAAEEQPFDLLISDIGLPDGTGTDVIRQIRQHTAIPAIALSGYGMEEDMARSRDAGFADHLVKPINLQQLEATINRLLGQ
jgi:PAS domain S-box-containing protein